MVKRKAELITADGLGRGSADLGVKDTEIATESRQDEAVGCSITARVSKGCAAKLDATKAAVVSSQDSRELTWFWSLLETARYERW